MKNILNKLIKRKKLFGVLFILVFGLWMIFNYVKRHGGEAMFDMQKINGVADNNPYGIRNDVYDFVMDDMKKSGIKELENPAVKNLLLNFVKMKLVEIKMFSDKEKTLEIGYQGFMIMGCIYRYRDTNKKDKTNVFFNNWITNSTTYSTSDLTKVIFKTNDHQIIKDIISGYFNGKTLNPDHRAPENHPELCDRYESKVLEEEEFWTKDPRVKGK